MRQRLMTTEYTIRGRCSLFVCRCCRTKFGWEHQWWCDLCSLTEPSCDDCRYYSNQYQECIHPALKKERREELPYEEDERPL